MTISWTIIPAAICKKNQVSFGVTPGFQSSWCWLTMYCQGEIWWRTPMRLSHAYLTVMSTFPNGVKPVSGVCSCLHTQPTDRLQILQTEHGELLPVLFTSLWVVLAPVLLEWHTGLLQHRAHHYLLHGGTAPAQRTVVWIPLALCVPAVFQAGFTESVPAIENHWLAENMSTDRTGKVILQFSTSAGHSHSQCFEGKAWIPGPSHGSAQLPHFTLRNKC